MELAENGASRADILALLSCMARHPDVDPDTGILAVRALLHIATDDNQVRSLLIEITVDQATDLNVVREACRALVYVADAGTRRELLDVLKREWPSQRAAFAAEALKDLGDDGLLTWIEEANSSLSTSHPYHELFERLKRHVEIQKSVPQMLTYIESEKEDIDRDWLVRQAMRHGATREQIRKAALAYLQRLRNERSSYGRVLLIKGCEEYDVFRPEDADMYKQIAEHREERALNRRKKPEWLRALEIKKAKFYRQHP